MVSRAQVYKDLYAICRFTDSACFCYNDIHRYDAQSSSTYDWKMFLEKSKHLFPHSQIKTLVRSGILRPITGGEYEVNMGKTTKNGGGICYSVDNKSIIFFFNDKTSSDFHTMYHEAAHALQREQELMDSDVILRYNSFFRKGIKKDTNGELAKKAAIKASYSSYLKEMHSEAFATACMLLRSESKFDFVKEKFNSFLRGEQRTINGMLTLKKKYPSSNFYASRPIEKAVRKFISTAQKNGEINQFYNPDKSLNFELLSKSIEKLVIKNVYSIEDFKNIRQKNIFGRRNGAISDWRLDGLKATSLRFISLPFTIAEGFRDFRLVCKHSFINLQNKLHPKKKTGCLKGDTPKTKAVNDLVRIDELRTDLARFCIKNKINFAYVIEAATGEIKNRVSEYSLINYRKRLKKHGEELYSPKIAKKLQKKLDKYFSDCFKIADEHKSDLYFAEGLGIDKHSELWEVATGEKTVAEFSAFQTVDETIKQRQALGEQRNTSVNEPLTADVSAEIMPPVENKTLLFNHKETTQTDIILQHKDEIKQRVVSCKNSKENLKDLAAISINEEGCHSEQIEALRNGHNPNMEPSATRKTTVNKKDSCKLKKNIPPILGRQKH